MSLVSVITPTYNRADVLPRAINSVLNQTMEDIEYIVVDDGSTDNTSDVVDEFGDSRINYIRHDSNKLQAEARNTGIKESNGKFLSFLDSDDEWAPEKLEKQVAYLDGLERNTVGVYCDAFTERSSMLKNIFTKLFPYKIRKEGRWDLVKDILTMQGNISAGSSLMVRAETAKDIGGFSTDMPRHEDIDFVLRLLRRGELGYIDEELVRVYESADPSAEMVAESKDHLLSNFEDEIVQLQAQGYPVKKYHNFHLARCYFSDGDFEQAFRHLKTAKASNHRQYLRLSVAICQGIRKHVI